MLRHISRPLALALLILLPAVAPAAQVDTTLVQASDLLRIQQLGDVLFSPDGSRIVYTVRTIERTGEGEYAYRNHLWLTPVDGSRAPRALTRGGASAADPQWHPDGRHIAFTRTREGTSQVFVLPLEGGEAFAVTNSAYGASSPRWSPTGDRIVFTATLNPAAADTIRTDAPLFSWERPGRSPGDTADRPDMDGDLAEVRAFLDRNARSGTAEVTTRLNFQAEQRLQPELSFGQVFVTSVDLTGSARPQTARRVSDARFAFSQARWLSNDVLVAVGPDDSSLHPDRDLTSALYSLRASGAGEPRRLFSLEGHALGAPQPSPDGRLIAFTASNVTDHGGYSEGQIGIIDIDGGNFRHLARDFDRSATEPTWAPDSRHLYFVAAADGGFPLFRISTTGSVDRLSNFQTGVRSFDVSRDAIAYVLTKVSNPFELYLDRRSPSSITMLDGQRVSDHNTTWLAGRHLATMEAASITREDGTVVPYWTMLPPGPDGRRPLPLIVQIHGGPSAMWGPGEASMWHEFQYLAARGYALAFSNPRGSGGYGFDFRRANFQDWGHGPGGDVLAMTDQVLRLPWADPSRLAVTGGSYAGYLTAWIISQDQRFHAAVAQRGVYDLSTFLGEGNAWRLLPNHMGGYPWEAAFERVIRENSPITYVQNIHTPLLIKHGSEDLRTGVTQSEMLYRSLKILDRPVEYVRHPGAGHDLSRTGNPAQRIDRLLRIYEFIARFVPANG
ncbi:S9 family peptidase [soil metagenome]